MGRVLVGLSSWAEPELIQRGFYPADVNTPAARLRYYAARFPVAEIDSSYHFFPTQHNLKLWLDNTPGGFTFDVRAFSLFTQHPTSFLSLPRTIREKYADRIEAKNSIYPHHLPKEAIDELWQIFGKTVASFKDSGKLGAILFQFPPWFHPAPQNYDYIAGCRKRLAEHRMAVEFRAGSWLDVHREQTLEFFCLKDITLVCVDEPQGLKTSVPPLLEVTSSLAIIRFHGRNKENWERKNIPVTAKLNYLYSEAELEEWADRIRQIVKKTGEIHLIFKNKHADFPARNAEQMKKLLGTT
jgi:uncharacterized protein YecE (DUF72 family)